VLPHAPAVIVDLPCSAVTHVNCTATIFQTNVIHTSRPLKKFASGVLAALRGSTYGREYASSLRLLRPCWTAFLNSLQL